MRAIIILIFLFNSAHATKLSELVEKTKERMKAEAHRITYTTYFSQKQYAIEKTVVDGEELIIVRDADDFDVVKLYIKDGFWYIYELKSIGWQKFRPFEAYSRFPYLYFCLQPSKSILSYEKDIEITSGKTFYEPLTEKSAKGFKWTIDQYEKTKDKRLEPFIDSYRAVLKTGLVRKIDPETGIFLLRGVRDKVEKSSLEWIDDDKIYEKPPTVSKDYSNPPNLKDPIFIRYNYAEKAHLSIMPDFCYLDLATKERRRLPVDGRIHKAIFTDNNQSVIYSYPEDGVYHLYCLDLKTLKKEVLYKGTGKNRYFSYSPLSNNGSLILLTFNRYNKYIRREKEKEEQLLLNIRTKEISEIPELIGLSITAWAQDDKSFITSIGSKVYNVTLEGVKTEITEGRVLGYFSKEEILLEKRTGEGPPRVQKKEYILYHLKDKTRKKLPITLPETGCSISVEPFKERILILQHKYEIVYPQIWKRGDTEPARISDETGMWSLPGF